MDRDVEIRIVSIKRFWIVTRPTPLSELGDICFECTFESLARQIRGGLQEEAIVGMYLEERYARRVAERLLEARDREFQSRDF